MSSRIEQEVALLRQRYPDLDYVENGCWVRIQAYPLPDGWDKTAIPVAFQIPRGYPGAAPYGFYVPSGTLFRGQRPQNYTEPAANQPPFGGSWGMFSWSPAEEWRPSADPTKGPNLLRWVSSFTERFREGA